jgi:transglutaminase-like putative cysteine protease
MPLLSGNLPTRIFRKPRERKTMYESSPRLPLLGLLLAGAVAFAPGAAGATAADAGPAATDPAVLIAAAGSAADYPDADAVVVFDSTKVDVEPTGLSHVVNRRLVKILTPAGARRQAFQRFNYDPATQLIEVRRVAIWRDGTTPEDVDLARLVDVTQPARLIYWGARMQALTLPDLRPGDAVEVETYRKGFMIAYLDGETETAAEERFIPPMRGHYYDVVLFQETLPLREKTYTLRTPRDKPVQYAVYNGAVASETTFDDAHFVYRFWTDGPRPAAPHEHYSPGRSDYVPKVVLTTVDGWPAKSRWFFEANAEQFEADPAIEAKVAALTEGLDSDAEKIAAINHWVAQNIRYCGHNMGTGEGYTLHPGPMVFTERAGVCKDIASMSITMLRAAGFETYPAMTMAGSRVEQIPADQFNHCVGAVRLDGGVWKLVDPTWVPFSRYDWSRAEGEQHFVIGTPWGEELMRTDPYPPEENQAALELRGRIAEDGTLAGNLKLTVSGYADTRLRRNLGLAPRDQVDDRLLRWLAGVAPGAELLAWRAGDPEDFGEPLQLELDFRLPRYAAVGERTVSWQPVAPDLVAAGFGGVFRLPDERLDAERETPALLWAAQRIEVDETVEVPRGYKPKAAEAPPAAGDEDDFAFCRTEAAIDGRRLHVQGVVQFQSRTIETAQWPVFRAAVNAWHDFAELRFAGRRERS